MLCHSFIRGMIIQDKSGNPENEALVNHANLLFCAFLSPSHSASSQFTCHDVTSFIAELQKRTCNRYGRLSDVFVPHILNS